MDGFIIDVPYLAQACFWISGMALTVKWIVKHIKD